MATKDRLAEELTKAGAPPEMIADAARGRYDDFESESATPTLDLIAACHAAGLKSFARRVMEDEFAGTKEESQAWFEREGQHLITGKGV